MAITEPVDFLPDWPGWNSLKLQYRQQKSGQAGGRVLVKDIGDPIWMMTAQSKRLRPNELDYWRARLETMEGGLVTFKGYALARTYPLLYPKGSWPTGGAFNGICLISAIGSENKSLELKSLPAGYAVSVGDLLQLNDNDLHRVVEAATADGSGVTPEFEVRPHIWGGPSGPGVNTPVYLHRPSCVMAIEPGSIEDSADLSGRGTISFRAFEAR